MLSGLNNWLINKFNWRGYQSEENNNFIPKGKENLVTPSPKTNSQIDPTTQSVLKDFENLNFKDKKCFDEIVDSYRKKGKINLFNSVILNKQKYITDMLY